MYASGYFLNFYSIKISQKYYFIQAYGQRIDIIYNKCKVIFYAAIRMKRE